MCSKGFLQPAVKFIKVVKKIKIENILIQKPLQSEYIFSFIMENEDELITELEDCDYIETKIVMIIFIVAKM